MDRIFMKNFLFVHMKTTNQSNNVNSSPKRAKYWHEKEFTFQVVHVNQSKQGPYLEHVMTMTMIQKYIHNKP